MPRDGQPPIVAALLDPFDCVHMRVCGPKSLGAYVKG